MRWPLPFRCPSISMTKVFPSDLMPLRRHFASIHLCSNLLVGCDLAFLTGTAQIQDSVHAETITRTFSLLVAPLFSVLAFLGLYLLSLRHLSDVLANANKHVISC